MAATVHEHDSAITPRCTDMNSSGMCPASSAARALFGAVKSQVTVPQDSLLQTLRAGISPFVEIRRDLHRHPELSFDEHRTSARVAELLTTWGYQVHRGLAGTGVVAQLTRGNSRRALGIRADMDALPIREATGLPYSSAHDGVMHACGHDGHTAMLLAAARHLALNPHFDGTLNLIFQPAEESGGGAKRMIEKGLFDRFPCDAVFAMHNMPGFPVGQLVFRDGAAMASSDSVRIVLKGSGGHGALPHRAADPLLAAASLVVALQTVVSRNIDPLQPAVVTVGALHSGAANNVIPDTARLELSVRSFSHEVRARIQERIRSIAQHHAAGFGVQAQIEWEVGYPVLVNCPKKTAVAREAGISLLGENGVVANGPQISGSEDFAYMLEHCPGSYLFIGNGSGECACTIHNPGYDFNDENLAVGAAYWVRLTERFLSREGTGN